MSLTRDALLFALILIVYGQTIGAYEGGLYALGGIILAVFAFLVSTVRTLGGRVEPDETPSTSDDS